MQAHLSSPSSFCCPLCPPCHRAVANTVAVLHWILESSGNLLLVEVGMKWDCGELKREWTASHGCRFWFGEINVKARSILYNRPCLTSEPTTPSSSRFYYIPFCDLVRHPRLHSFLPGSFRSFHATQLSDRTLSRSLQHTCLVWMYPSTGRMDKITEWNQLIVRG